MDASVWVTGGMGNGPSPVALFWGILLVEMAGGRTLRLYGTTGAMVASVWVTGGMGIGPSPVALFWGILLVEMAGGRTLRLYGAAGALVNGLSLGVSLRETGGYLLMRA